MLTSAKDVMNRARELAQKRLPMVAIAGAEDDDVLKAVCNAQKAGMVGAILVGNEAKIRKVLEELGEDAAAYTIVHSKDPKETVALAVEQCSQGKAQILMKGKVATPDLMKAVLAPKAGLRMGKNLSHCAVLEMPGVSKLISFTDGGVLAAPDFGQKISIVENAVKVSRLLGVTDPKVAVLGVMNEADPELPATMEAAALARTCFVRGLTKYIEGPLTMAATLKGLPAGTKWSSAVAGDADIIVANGIEEANMAVKSILNLRTGVFMGVISGARVPFSLVSRADPPENKLASLALAAVMAGAQQ
jgi:phosphate butyryltransferase